MLNRYDNLVRETSPIYSIKKTLRQNNLFVLLILMNIRSAIIRVFKETGADVLVQGTLIILTLIGILRRRQFGFVTGVTLTTIWIYVTLMIPLQRIGLYNWGVVPDLSRAKVVGPLMVALWGIPGVISLICLTANRDFFNSGKSDQS